MRSLIFYTTLLFSITTAAQEELVMHWDDGSTMDCRFVFQSEEVYQLDPIELPVTVHDAYGIIQDWAASQGGGKPFIRNFRLISVLPAGHSSGVWAWFMDYLPTSATNFDPIYLGNFRSIAVTMGSQIVVGQCHEQLDQ